MKGMSETSAAPDPAAAAEMALIRIAYAADLPTPDEALRMLKESAGAGGDPAGGDPVGGAPRPSGARAGPAPSGGAVSAGALARQPAPEAPAPQNAPTARAAPSVELRSLEDVVRHAGRKRDAKLKVEIESYVHLVNFTQGRIDMRLHERAPANLPGRITQALKDWTGLQWVVTVDDSAEGAPTLRDARTAEVMADPAVMAVFSHFPEAEILAIRDLAPAAEPSPDEGREGDRQEDDRREDGEPHGGEVDNEWRKDEDG